MIIGITGTLGAGKGTIVKTLIEKGFRHFSASDFITQEVIKREMPVNRDSMIRVANDLRNDFGPGYIIAELLKQAISMEGDAVVESIRTPGEVEKLKDAGGILLGVNADQKIRFERIKDRKSSKDNVTFDKFCKQEKLEMKSNNPNEQNIRTCLESAKTIIDNNGTVEDLKKQVLNFLKHEKEKK